MTKTLVFIEQLENTRNKYTNFINAVVRRRELRNLAKKVKGNVIAVAFNQEQENALRSLDWDATIVRPATLTRSDYDKVSKMIFFMTKKSLAYDGIQKALTINNIDFSDVMAHHIIYNSVILLRNTLKIKKTIEEYMPNEIIVQGKYYTISQIASNVAETKNIRCSYVSSGIISYLKSRARTYMGRKIFFEGELYATRAQLFSLGYEKGKKILVDARYINHLRSILPVINVLKKHGHHIYAFSFEDDMKRLFNHFVPVHIKLQQKTKKHDLQCIIGQIEKDKTFLKIFNFYGINLWGIMRNMYMYLFSDGLNKLVTEAVTFEALIMKMKPDAVIVSDDRVIGARIHVLVAQKCGIKTVDIQHGVFPYTEPMNTPVSDLLIVGGESTKKQYVSFGADPHRVKIVGWPRYDNMKSQKTIRLRRFLFAPDAAYTFQNKEILRKIETCIDDNDTLIVKPHPGDDEKIYSDTISRKNVYVVPRTDNILDHIRNADAVITMASTTGLEALLLGKPVIIINLGGEENIGHYYSSCGVAVEITDLNEITCFKQILKKDIRKIRKNMKSFIKMNAFKMDGKSSKRAAKEIEKILI